MKNILFIHQSAELYGSDKVLLLLCAGLQQTGEFHPIVIIPENGPLEAALIAEGIEVHHAEVAKISRAVFSPMGLFRLVGKVIQGCRELSKIVNSRRIDVVHSNTLAVLVGACWAALHRKKHIWHVHEIILSPRLVSLIYPRLASYFSHRVISNSSLTEEWLLNVVPTLKPRSDVIFNGLPVTVPPSPDLVAAFRQSIKVKDEEILISLVGRVNHWKGQDLLVAALDILQQQKLLDGVKIAIVGDTAQGKEYLLAKLRDTVNEKGLADRVSFVPFLNDVWPVWFATDIAVVPSTEPEPFGMVAIEAMSAKIPVVAAQHGGLLDIIDDGVTGLFFKPRDAADLAAKLATLIAEASLRKEMGEKGCARQHQLFSLQAQVEATITTYRRVIANE